MGQSEFKIGAGLQEKLAALQDGELSQVQLHVAIGKEQDRSLLHMQVIDAVQEIVPHAFITATFKEAEVTGEASQVSDLLLVTIRAFASEYPAQQAS